MAAKKFLRQVAGRIQEILGVQSSSGVANAGDIPALDDTGRLDVSMMPVGVTAETKQAVASEALNAGDMVNLWLSGGVLKARKADATAAGKEADGFVLAAFALGATAQVFLPSNTNTQRSGLNIGNRYYLDTTAGGITDTAPAGSGNVVQCVGKALSATELAFEPGDPITLA